MGNYVDIRAPKVHPGPPTSFPPLTWAKQNCPSYITNDAVDKNGVYYYRFYFGREQDQIVFALKWL